MPTVTITSNPASSSEILVSDIGEEIPEAGNSVSFSEHDTLLLISQSKRLRELCTDGLFSGSHSLSISINGQNVSSSKVDAALKTLPFQDQGPYSLISRDDAGQHQFNQRLNILSGGNSIINDPGSIDFSSNFNVSESNGQVTVDVAPSTSSFPFFAYGKSDSEDSTSEFVYQQKLALPTNHGSGTFLVKWQFEVYLNSIVYRVVDIRVRRQNTPVYTYVGDESLPQIGPLNGAFATLLNLVTILEGEWILMSGFEVLSLPAATETFYMDYRKRSGNGDTQVRNFRLLVQQVA